MACQANLHPVRTAISIAEVSDRPADIASGPLTEDNGFRSVFRPDFLEAFFAGVEGFFPGYLLPFVFTACSHPFQGMANPVRMIHVLGQRQYARAGPSLVPGIALIPFNPEKYPVLYLQLLTAAAVTTRPRRPRDSFEFPDTVFYSHIEGIMNTSPREGQLILAPLRAGENRGSTT